VFVSSKCEEFIFTLSKEFSNEKIASGFIEKQMINIKQNLKTRIRLVFMMIFYVN